MKIFTEINYRVVAERELSLIEAIEYCKENKIEHPRFVMQILKENDSFFDVDEINTTKGTVDHSFCLSFEEREEYLKN